MLVITVNDGFEINWHVGNPIPKIWQSEDPSKGRRHVVGIYADGDELEHIFKLVPSLKSSYPGSMRTADFAGQTAKILYALLLVSGSGQK